MYAWGSLVPGITCNEGKMNEKRKHKRLNLFAFEGSDLLKSLNTDDQKISGMTDDAIPLSLFLLTDRTTGEVAGHLVDISLGGIMIIGERPIEKGRCTHSQWMCHCSLTIAV